jgi:hypothetical protein
MRCDIAIRQTAGLTALAAGWFLFACPAYAWTFPEHVRISQSAFRSLAGTSDTKEAHDAASPSLEAVRARWHAFRNGIDKSLRLCPESDDEALILRRDKDDDVACVPLQALPALAGDHACTPAELGKDLGAAGGEWVLDVLDVAQDTANDLREVAHDEGECSAACVAGCRKKVGDSEETECESSCWHDCEEKANRDAIRRQMHVDMQSADSSYVPRAVRDYSHFQAVRRGPLLGAAGLENYLRAALKHGVEANATAAYVNYHVAAVRLALRARRHSAELTGYYTWALLTEAFALHFLEDLFSAGHIVGHWGSKAVRQGTHDYYCSNGVQATRWTADGKMAPENPKPPLFVARGDAFLRDDDIPSIADAVQTSMLQVVDAATASDAEAAKFYAEFGSGDVSPNVNSCTETVVRGGLSGFGTSSLIKQVLQDEPVPATRDPEMMRVSAENGIFIGAAATIQAARVQLEPVWNSKSWRASGWGTAQRALSTTR